MNKQNEPTPTVDVLSFVQPVPDHCDRIVWRDRYYHLPLEVKADPVESVLEQAEPPPAQDERHSGPARYRVAPTGRGFWPFCVRAGDGTREVFVGHRKACERVAAELAVAFEDGKFVATRPAQTALSAVTAERDAAQKDALRYRWLRDEGYLESWESLHVCDEHLSSERIDAKIDAAMSAEAEGGRSDGRL